MPTLRRRVVLFATGGTISSVATPEGIAPRYGGQELLDALAQRGMAPEGMEVEVREFGRVLSGNLDPLQMFELARRIQQAAGEPGVDGVVVTHGTGAMEETSFLVDLYHALPVPVVFTGAMRPASDPDADGWRNLRDALRVAADPEARGKGVLVVLNGLILPASDATKSHTSALETFEAPEFGPLGAVDPGGGPRWLRAPVGRQVFELVPPEPNVDLIRFYTGMDDRFVRASLAAGARGIVVEGSGLGNVNRAMAEALRQAVGQGVAVVMASRCYRGSAYPLYGTPGGGQDLARAGVIFSSYRSGLKSRLLLCVALGHTRDPERLAAIFGRGRGA